MDRRRFQSLDGIRCFCILAVIWHHAPETNDLGLNFFNFGFLGVDMFFVLSGFLITTLLIRERQKFGRISLSAFWARRSLRIFPLYYITLVGVVFGYLSLRGDDPETQRLLSDIPFHVFYLSNWRGEAAANLGPLWSLATEEQFYLVWPVIECFAAVQLRRLLLGLLIFVNVLFATRIGVPALFEGGLSHPIFGLSIMQTTFLPILLGVGLAHLLHSRRWYSILRALAGWRWAPVAWGGAVLALVEFGPTNIQGGPRIALQLGMTMVVASVVTQEKHALSRVLNLSLITRIGAVSYGMYLLHLWGMDLVLRVSTEFEVNLQRWPVPLFVLIVLVTLVASDLSFRFIESPILGFKKRFTRVDVSRDVDSGGAA